MQPGMNVGSYRIIEQVGLGGMATVFKAYDPGMDRYVAIKIVSPQFAQHPEFRERFRREAKSIAKLEHPHIIPVHAFGEEGETAYLVLRYMDTGTLRDQMNHHPMDFHKARRLVDQIADALDYAHRNGVIHRDVKPSNVLIDSEGNAYLTDFGIAKIVEATVELTGTGTAMGTPQYMSPEQCRGDKDLTAATDTYSLGVILYQMVTGTLPFDAETPLAVIHQHLNDPLPPPRTINPQVTEAMERVLFKALAKEPDDRYSSTSDLARAFAAAVSKLETVAAPAPPAKPPSSSFVEPGAQETRRPMVRRVPSWAWALGGLVLVVGVLGGLLATSAIDLPGRSESVTSTPSPVTEAEPPTPAPTVVAAGIADLNPDPALLEDPIPFGGHYYGIARERSRWEEADRIARELGGYLVSINDLQENQFVHQTFASGVPDDELAFWLGLSDQGEAGSLEWASGEPVSYTNWDEFQPDAIGEDPVCVHMFPWGGWDDVPCADDFHLLALVEFEQLPVPGRVAEQGLRPQAVSADLGRGNAVHGLIQLEFEGDGITGPATIGGREARVTRPNGTGGRFIYFEVDDSFIHREPSPVLIAVEYFDRGSHAFWLDYDSVQSEWRNTRDVELTDSGEWKTAIFSLPDAYFAGRQHEGADFRIALGDEDLHVDRVTVALDDTPMAEAISDPWGHVFLGSGEPIVLGVSAAFSSPQAEPLAVGQIDATRLALDRFGSVYGSAVEILEADSGCNSEGGRAAAEELVSARGIVAVVGPTCSRAVAEAGPVFEIGHLVFITPSATRVDLGQSGLETFNRAVLSESSVPESRSSDIEPDNPAYQEFAAAFEERYGRTCCERFAPHAYDATLILLNAIQAVSVVDETGNIVVPRQRLAEFVRSTQGWPGVSGEITFDEAGNRVLP